MNSNVGGGPRSRRLVVPGGQVRAGAMLTALAWVLVLAYATVAIVSIGWFEHEHHVRHHLLRDPALLVNTKVDHRFTTPAYWSKILALWRLVVLTALVATLSVRGTSPYLWDIAWGLVLIGVILEAILFAYLLAERYLLGCNTCTYAPNTCHGRAWCDACFLEYPDVCANAKPVLIQPDAGVSRYWRRRVAASGGALIVGIALAVVTWLRRDYGITVAPDIKGELLERDLAWAGRGHAWAIAALAVVWTIMVVAGVHSFSWSRFAAKEGTQVSAADPHGHVRVSDARFGWSWWLFGPGMAAVFGALISAAPYLLTRGRRDVRSVHMLSLLGSLLLFAGVVAVCTVGLYMCNQVSWPFNPCHDRRYCCARADALAGVTLRCEGITQNCPLGGGGGLGLPDPSLLHPNRPFQIVYVTGGFGLLFTVISLVTLNSHLNARERLIESFA